MSGWKCGIDKSLPVVSLGKWDGDSASKEIFEWATEGEGDESKLQPEKAMKCFLFYDSSAPDQRGSYKFPVARILNGEPKIVAEALSAAASRLGMVKDIPGGEMSKAMSAMKAYRGKAHETRKAFELTELDNLDAEALSSFLKELVDPFGGHLLGGISPVKTALAGIPTNWDLDEMRGLVTSAWRKKFVPKAPSYSDSPVSLGEDELDARAWSVRAVFRDNVIAQNWRLNRYVSYPYEVVKGLEVVFGEPVPVTIQWIPVEQAFSLSDTPSFEAESSSPMEELPESMKASMDMLNTLAVKAVDDSDQRVKIGLHLLLWGSPTEKDIHDNYFTKATDLGLDTYPTPPTYFHHRLDRTVSGALGVRDKAVKTEAGLWIESWVNKSNNYWKMVSPLLKQKRLFGSPGSAPHLIDAEPDGHLKMFHIIEDTITPTPAQYRLISVGEVEVAYKACGLEVPSGMGTSAGQTELAAGLQSLKDRLQPKER